MGPSQFQWTDQQIELVRSLLSLLPDKLRTYRSGTLKAFEGRPTVAEVVAVSPFESIRSAEIFPLFKRHLQMVKARALGTPQSQAWTGFLEFRSDRVGRVGG